MSALPREIVDVAENLNISLPPRGGVRHVARPTFVAIVGAEPGPHHNVVQRLRLEADDVARTVDEVRALFASHDRRSITWEIGGSATPTNLAALLAPHGIVPFADNPHAIGMVLSRPLQQRVADVAVRRVTTIEDFRVASRIFAVGFGGADAPLPDEATVAAAWARRSSTSDVDTFLAFVGDVPAAAAEATYLPVGVVMGGAATLPELRGKGAYRALVAARWLEGQRRGTPVLITQAGPMSRPILRELGFDEVVEVRIFYDEF